MTPLANLTSKCCSSIITIFRLPGFPAFPLVLPVVLRLFMPLLLAVQREEAAARVITTATNGRHPPAAKVESSHLTGLTWAGSHFPDQRRRWQRCWENVSGKRDTGARTSSK
ncbi:uncharacterized protein [Drosophila kikkawai]|uniref:Uncharacterized protein isoform X2 n=1 Tax=Drosophila kikkawai TaxID=30033 RepID=A0ABM4GDU1_DROKI